MQNQKLSQDRPSIPPYDYQPDPYVGLSKQQIIDLRQQYVNPVVATYYQQPIMIVEGSMQYVFDETGKRYLDGFAGIATINLGHCHPHVVKAVQEQSAKLQHTTTLYLHPTIAEYSKMLVDKMPDHLSMVYFVNSGSEANDLAMLMARVYTENFDIITLQNGYHGMSGNSMGLTSQSTWKYYTPHNFGIHHAINADVYRGAWNNHENNVAYKYANEVKNLIQYATSGKIAGFIAESIQGVGGTIVYPDGYLKKVYDYVHQADGLFIADEVQTGFCRTGAFWGFELHDVKPDIVTLAKGIGNGVPLAAVVTTPEIAQAFTKKIHFNTFAGNPVSCAAGKAVLEIIERENIQQNCALVGEYLLKSLQDLQETHECIGDVRGCGLMIGVDLVKNRQTKEPNPELLAQIHELSKDLGLLIGKGGLHRNVIRIKPPLCITKADVDFIIKVLEFALNYYE
ncbi:aspartate aminotransferase family protein [Moorena sp. SIO3A2]|uniref:aspartate aminotransferase family protein n=1 Tax=Moorena sp. SIO3A2 TaxID=2607841 RepID=UPI0013B90F26|nr:aspartate aminotransferase family protein [Moorena sp. SIO3A2]NER86515.1 aspartate aminotransferase family protein [Moorena sp. SIO3A2]